MEGMVLFSFLWLALRVAGPIYCALKADKLNRNMGIWAVLGFLFPIICMILISTLKPVTLWNKEK